MLLSKATYIAFKLQFYILSALAFPGNRTHDLGVASAMLYYLSYRKAPTGLNYVSTGCNKWLVYNGFYCFSRVTPGHAITIQGKGRNISVSRLRHSANHNAPYSWPIRARLASQNDELCNNRRVSERQSTEEQQ